MQSYKILLADDHALFREGLKRILAEASELKVIGEVADGLELLKTLNRIKPDMIILDISMPNIRGIEAIQEIKAIHPETKILVLTMHSDIEYLHQAISSGAHGYLLKEDADGELFSAIDKVKQGKIYVSPKLSEYLTEDWARIHRGEHEPASEIEPLTTREREILKLVAEGKSSKEVASLLNISIRTVEHHRAKIMDKLNLKNVAELIKYAIQKGYI
ncbi:MAG: response regulator transcription factor [Nitrospirae bacterium]|jgi:DNA-binding NarL/FixJ family response regulator|nr:response regulator transcription factor [Nitrospirota bacterium]